MRAELEALREDKTLDNLAQTVAFLKGQLAKRHGDEGAAQEERNDGNPAMQHANLFSDLDDLKVD